MKKRSKKTEALIEDIIHDASEYLAKQGKTGATRAELLKALNLPPFLKPFFEEALEELLMLGEVKKENSRFIFTSMIPSTIEGVLSLHPRGFGFVKTHSTPDIFIASDDMNGGIDGDRVEVLPSKEISEKGPDGKILRVIDRKRKFLIAHILQPLGHKQTKYMAFIPILGKDRFGIVDVSHALQYGERIVMSIEEIEPNIRGKFLKSLATIDDASKDVDVAGEEYGLKKQFSKEAIAEAKRLTIDEKHEISTRKDLKSLRCITIDPKTAKDFDDAISILKTEKGYQLGVHIADVAHFVKTGSLLDQEAFLRSNSTYFPRTVIPMLPFELSSDLCSLKPNQPRLTMTLMMDFDPEGNLLSYQIFRSIIESKKRFSYPEVSEILQSQDQSPFSKDIFCMKELALLLKKKRTERGSFDFALPEAVVEVDPEGNPQRIVLHEYDISHQIIEEFMLKTNEIVAKHLSQAKKVAIYRIHESPTEENMESFFALARSIGLPLSSKPSHEEIQKLFSEAESTSFGKELAVQYIRSMKLAYYSPDNIGHYGLALEHYTHFTSPIRRYSDLIIQRLLFDDPIDKDITEIAQYCSEKERNSMKAEQSVIFLKKLRLLAKHHRKEPQRSYKALVSSIKPFGILFQVKEFYLEGFLHISSFEDYMIFDSKTFSLTGEKTTFTLNLGDSINVKIAKVDLPTLSVEWEFSPS